MVEQVDLDDKKEDKAANKVVDDVIASKHASHYYVHGPLAGQGMLEFKNQRQPPLKMLRLIQNQ